MHALGMMFGGFLTVAGGLAIFVKRSIKKARRHRAEAAAVKRFHQDWRSAA